MPSVRVIVSVAVAVRLKLLRPLQLEKLVVTFAVKLPLASGPVMAVGSAEVIAGWHVVPRVCFKVRVFSVRLVAVPVWSWKSIVQILAAALPDLPVSESVVCSPSPWPTMLFTAGVMS